MRIDGDKIIPAVGDILQTVHPVNGTGQELVILLLNTIVPAAPHLSDLWHRRFVGMQNGFVVLIVKGAQDLFFLSRWIGQQLQGLISMTGEDNAVILLWMTISGKHSDQTVCFADHLDDGCIGAVLFAEWSDQQFPVGLAAFIEGPPLMLGIETKKTMV